MKRLLSLLLSLGLLLSLVSTAFASGGPPYSLQYLEGITGVTYGTCIELDDIREEDYSRTHRTLEAYDALLLYLVSDGSWSVIVAPFRNAFQNAGFSEEIVTDNNNQDMYCYILGNETFAILGEKNSQAILNESGIVYIEHSYVAMDPTTPTPGPDSAQEPSPTPTVPEPDTIQEPNPNTPTSVPTALTAQQAAESLYEMGLFKGTGIDANGNPIFDLDRAPTRHEAVTMLVRLLGKEDEAIAGNWSIPFMDVAEWAIPYVGYAYANGLASGTSAETFSGNDTVTATQYLTFVLRALGYESGTDFQWDKAWELSDSIGLTDGRYNAGTSSFTRGDVAIISYGSLSTPKKVQVKEEFPTENNNPPASTIPEMGSLAHEKVFCKKGGTAMVWLQNATAAKWEACCGDVLITQSSESTCDIYVLSTASTIKHHYVMCTDSNGYKYSCMIELI